MEQWALLYTRSILDGPFRIAWADRWISILGLGNQVLLRLSGIPCVIGEHGSQRVRLISEGFPHRGPILFREPVQKADLWCARSSLAFLHSHESLGGLRLVWLDIDGIWYRWVLFAPFGRESHLCLTKIGHPDSRKPNSSRVVLSFLPRFQPRFLEVEEDPLQELPEGWHRTEWQSSTWAFRK